MQKKDFSFTLPDSLIAQKPCEQRTQSRLLSLSRHSGEIVDRQFTDLLNLLKPGDLLLMNNTRVIPARLYGKKTSGGAVEVLIESLQGENKARAFIKASKSPKPGSHIIFTSEISAEVTTKEGGLFELVFSGNKNLLAILDELGEIPLPPYMHREADDADKARYQTVYASSPGAVAAPTAGLHFDRNLLDRIGDKGVRCEYVTLHVGAGTFQPIRVENILEHKMHSEYIEIDQSTCDAVNQTRKNGGRVIAVGTTVVRVIESASNIGKFSGELKPYQGETDIFIYPGYKFNIIDGLVTNFHLPESTLLMLVSAFAGKESIIKAYQHAIEQKYRFYSYGDAMFIA